MYAFTKINTFTIYFVSTEKISVYYFPSIIHGFYNLFFGGGGGGFGKQAAASIKSRLIFLNNISACSKLLPHVLHKYLVSTILLRGGLI